MTNRAELQRLIASEFTRRGWDYDLTVGPNLADRILQGERDPATLAKAFPTGYRRQNRASLDDILDAINRVLPSITDLTEVASAMRILFVSAGPVDEARLRLEAEHRDIRDRIRASTLRDQVLIESAGAARPTDLIDAINRFQPSILHLAGHGGPTGIALEDSDGRAVDVSTDQLVRVVGAAGNSLRLVVLNTCESAAQAKPIATVIDSAIGMKRTIGDDAARTFAVQLYSSLAEGVELDRAFEQARLQISLAGLHEDDTPALFIRSGIAGGSIRFTS